MTECQTGNLRAGHLQLFFSSKRFSLLRSALLSNFWLLRLQYIKIKDGLMARGQCKGVWDQLMDLSHDPTMGHWSFVVLMGTQVLVQTGSFPSLFWFFPVSSQLSALCTVDAKLSWVFNNVSDLLYSVCTFSLQVYLFSIIIIIIILYINVYVTNKTL